MWRQLFFGLSLILATFAIKVPVDPVDNDKLTADEPNAAKNKPIYYKSDDANVDSYLIPPDPHRPEDVQSDVATPATYLLPPSADEQANFFYAGTEAGDQGDWYPIQAQQPSAPEVKQPQRAGKLLKTERVVAIPSDHLEPPLVNAPNDYTLPAPSEELELPAEEINKKFVHPELIYSPNGNLKPRVNTVLNKDAPVRFRVQPEELALVPHLLPPKADNLKFKNPTKLYPKKYPGTFRPVPIPIVQFAEDGFQPPKAKPVKIFNPALSAELDYATPDDKRTYLYAQADLKRKLKEEEAAKQSQLAVEAYGAAIPTEQETSETFQRYPERPAPLRQASALAPAAQEANAAPPSDDRTEFRMHGMKGPHSYQFGYDTGKGKNRQFRYEERDNDGYVKGHYGYMDKHGKLRVVNYRAHPEHGFEADTAPVDKE